jgi:hypothetical protein
MAMWHLYRMETDPNIGPLSLSCADGENATKFTLYDSNNNVYDTTIACVPRELTPEQVLELLTSAGYTPSEWHS